MRKHLLFVIMTLSCLSVHAQSETETLVSLTKVNYVGIREFSAWSQFPEDQPEDKVEVEANGIAITNAKLQSQSWQTQVMVVPDGKLNLEKGHDYVVRLTVKVPSDGTYIINLGNSKANYAVQISVNASDDFQIVDVEYPEYQGTAKDANVVMDCGWVVGTTVVKEVEVFERLGFWSGYFIELTPDKSVVYKFVMAMDNKSQETISNLYASMKETGDKSIIKCTETGAGGWYVRKDYPLPEGNYYESAIYTADSPSLENQLVVVLPKFNCYVNWRGRVEDLLEYLGNQVTADYISEPDLSGGTTCYFTCNLNTSDEVLELGMRVKDVNIEGMNNFHPHLFLIDKTYNNYLISVMTGANKDDNLIYSMNWEGVDYPMTDMSPDAPQKTTDEGLAIFNPKMQEYAGGIWTYISAGGFNVVENHNYVVRMTMKVPSNGKYFVRMGHGEATCQQEVSVIGDDDWQIVDVQFPDFLGGMTYYDSIDGDASIFLTSGWVVGTTVIKKVEVYEMTESGSRESNTAIKVVKTTNSDDNVYNLAGQRVSPSYKGVVIRNGRKVVN